MRELLPMRGRDGRGHRRRRRRRRHRRRRRRSRPTHLRLRLSLEMYWSPVKDGSSDPPSSRPRPTDEPDHESAPFRWTSLLPLRCRRDMIVDALGQSPRVRSCKLVSYLIRGALITAGRSKGVRVV